MQWGTVNRHPANGLMAALMIGIGFLAVGYYLNTVQSNQDYVAQGEVFERLPDYNSAIVSYTHALDDSPNDLDLLRRRAQNHLNMGSGQAALDDINRALGLLYVDRGQVHHALGQYEQAIADFTTALAFDPTGQVDALNGRGLSYASLGDTQRAIADFDAALALAPDQWVGYNGRGQIYAQLGQDVLALADFETALAHAPDEAAIYLSLGDFCYDRGDFEAATHNYQRHHELAKLDAADRAVMRVLALQAE